MQFLEWKEEYELGIKEIDIQHRGLFDIVSKLSNTRKYETKGKYFLATFDKLFEYARIHFATEERYMRESNYPKLMEHRQEHGQFLAELEKVRMNLERNEPSAHQAILEFVKGWYELHILGTDRDYQQFLKTQGFK